MRKFQCLLFCVEAIIYVICMTVPCISRGQAVIKIIDQKERNKQYIKNWRPISLLSVYIKVLSKAI